MGKGDDPNCNVLMSGGAAMSTLLEEPVAAAVTSITEPRNAMGEKLPAHTPNSIRGDAKDMAVEQIANAIDDEYGSRNGRHATTFLGAFSESGRDLTGKKIIPLTVDTNLAASVLTGALVDAGGPAPKLVQQDPEKPRIIFQQPRAPRKAQLAPVANAPEISVYRAKAAAAIGLLLTDFPIWTPEHDDDMSSRGYSDVLEKKWLASVPDDYYIKFPDGQHVKIVKPHSNRYWFDFAFVSEDEQALWPINLKAVGKAKSAGNIAGLRAMRFMLTGEVMGDAAKTSEPESRLQVPHTTNAKLATMIRGMHKGDIEIPTTSRDYFVLNYNHTNGQTRTAPLLGLVSSSLVANPRNDLQVAASTAPYQMDRPVDESVSMFIEKIMELRGKQWVASGVPLGVTDERDVADPARRDAKLELHEQVNALIPENADIQTIQMLRQKLSNLSYDQLMAL